MINGNKAIMTDEELDYLANLYLKLQKSKTYRNLSKTFQDYIKEFLDSQLLEFKKLQFKEKKNG